MITRRRKIIVGVVLVVIGTPVALALTVTVFFSILNPVLLNVSNQTSGTIVSSGQKREYLLHVPRSYDPAKATPLVISMHAAALWPAAQMEASQWNKVADQHGFIVVYPSGTGMAPLPFLPSLPVWHNEVGSRPDGECQIHLGVDRYAEISLQRRPDEDLCQRALQWRRRGLRAFLELC